MLINLPFAMGQVAEEDSDDDDDESNPDKPDVRDSQSVRRGPCH